MCTCVIKTGFFLLLIYVLSTCFSCKVMNLGEERRKDFPPLHILPIDHGTQAQGHWRPTQMRAAARTVATWRTHVPPQMTVTQSASAGHFWEWLSGQSSRSSSFKKKQENWMWNIPMFFFFFNIPIFKCWQLTSKP